MDKQTIMNEIEDRLEMLYKDEAIELKDINKVSDVIKSLADKLGLDYSG